MIKFISTEGQEYENPPLSQFIQAVEAGNQTEWEGYSGQAGIYWRDDKGDRQIIFTPSGADKYILQYYDNSSEQDYYFISSGGGNVDDITEVYVGGDPWLIPANLFVSKADALIVLAHFYNTHERSDAIEWVKNSEVDWPEE